jgi:hypothetical protein
MEEVEDMVGNVGEGGQMVDAVLGEVEFGAHGDARVANHGGVGLDLTEAMGRGEDNGPKLQHLGLVSIPGGYCGLEIEEGDFESSTAII